MTEEELQEIEERCQRATAGPWSLVKIASLSLKSNLGKALMIQCQQEGFALAEIARLFGMTKERAKQMLQKHHQEVVPGQVQLDYAFIAHARTDVPVLLAEIRRLQTEVEEWKTAAEVEADLATEFATGKPPEHCLRQSRED